MQKVHQYVNAYVLFALSMGAESVSYTHLSDTVFFNYVFYLSFIMTPVYHKLK